MEIQIKSPEQLSQQVSAVDNLLGPNNPIYPPIPNNKFITSQEAQEKYPFRYGLYRDLIKRRGEPLDPTSDNETINRIRKLQFINAVQQHLTEGGGVLREKQQIAFQSIVDGLEQGIEEGYLKLPTGFGKTVMFTELARLAVSAGLRVTVVVPTKILLKQTQEKGFTKFAPDVPVGVFYGDEEKNASNPVTITTYDSLENIDPNSIDILILDEAHRGFSSRRQELIKQANTLFTFGFTATPDASEERTLDKILPHKFHEVTRREAVREGILSPYRVMIVKTQADLSKVKISEGGEFDAQQLDKAINTEVRNQAAVEFYKRAFDGEQAVAYCNSIAHAEALAKKFNDGGVPAAVIHGEMSQKEREDVQNKYTRGEIKVICNMKLLIEGWDEPKASVCLNLAPTLSIINADQRGGRVLRIDESNPNKIAYIVEFVDKNENPRTQPLLFSHLDDVVLAPEEKRDEIEKRSGEVGNRLKEFPIEGLEVFFEEKEVLRISKEIQDMRPKDVPEGWIAMARLVEQSGRGYTYIRNRLKDGMYQKTGGAIYVEPEAASRILEDTMNRAPEGYIPISYVARAGLSADQIRTILRDHGNEDTNQYAGYYPGTGGHLSFCLSPEGIALVEREKRNYITDVQQKREGASLKKQDREARSIYTLSNLPLDALRGFPRFWVDEQLRMAFNHKTLGTVVEDEITYGTPTLTERIKAKAEAKIGDAISIADFQSLLSDNGMDPKKLTQFLEYVKEKNPDLVSYPFSLRTLPYINKSFAHNVLVKLKEQNNKKE